MGFNTPQELMERELEGGLIELLAPAIEQNFEGYTSEKNAAEICEITAVSRYKKDRAAGIKA